MILDFQVRFEKLSASAEKVLEEDMYSGRVTMEKRNVSIVMLEQELKFQQLDILFLRVKRTHRTS